MFGDLLSSYIVEGIQHGTIRAEIDPGAASTAIMGQLRSIVGPLSGRFGAPQFSVPQFAR